MTALVLYNAIFLHIYVKFISCELDSLLCIFNMIGAVFRRNKLTVSDISNRFADCVGTYTYVPLN
jgi:hypothetical protein